MSRRPCTEILGLNVHASWPHKSCSFYACLRQKMSASSLSLIKLVPKATDGRALRTIVGAWRFSWVKQGHTYEMGPWSSICEFQQLGSWMLLLLSDQFSRSVVADSATPWTAAHQASLSITSCWSPPNPMSIESVMPSNHLILCRPLLLLPSIFPSIRVFSNDRGMNKMCYLCTILL